MREERGFSESQNEPRKKNKEPKAFNPVVATYAG